MSALKLRMRETIDSLARDIDDDRETTGITGLSDEFGGDELGDRLGEVDAVDEDVD